MNAAPKEDRVYKPTSNILYIVLLCFPIIVGAFILWAKLTDPSLPADPSHFYPNFPLPEELPVPAIKGFKIDHPRLPAPSTEDIIRLQAENPKFLMSKHKEAKKLNGKIESIVLTIISGMVGISRL